MFYLRLLVIELDYIALVFIFVRDNIFVYGGSYNVLTIEIKHLDKGLFVFLFVHHCAPPFM